MSWIPSGPKLLSGQRLRGVNKGLDALLVVNESDCFTDVVDMTATASVGIGHRWTAGGG